MDQDKLILYGALAVGGYLVYRHFVKPDGMDKEGLANTATRAGLDTYPSTFGESATYVQVGNTTYKIRDSELSQTGFIKRRAALGSVTGLNNFQWFNNWVYS